MIKLFFLGILLHFTLTIVDARFCVKKEDCLENLDCNNGLCMCAPGKVLSQDGINCIDIALGIGTECTEDIQCLSWIIGPSVCTKDGLCGCKPGYRYRNNKCTQVSEYNGLCWSDYDCYDGINSNALKCDGGICNCNYDADYYLRGGFDCRISGQDKCFFNVDCPNDKCCEFKYGPLGECLDNVVSNECLQLDSNYDIYYKKYDELIFLDGYTSIVSLHLKCNKIEDCSEVANSICPEFRKECTCKYGFAYQQSTNSCVPVLGSSCENDEDCSIKHSFCNANKICTCSDYFINSNYNDKCFKPARDIGMSCARDENCYSLGIYAICNDHKCKCNDNTKFDRKLMLCRPQNVTDTCNNNCKNKLHSTCINSECVCDKHYLDNGFKCLPDIGYGCSNISADCLIENAHCNNNKCECLPGYVQDGNRKCKITFECFDDCKIKPHSFCNQFIGCVCEAGYLDDGYKCLPDLGYECDMENNLCKIPNAECKNHKCECIEGFVKESRRNCKKEETEAKPCVTIIQIHMNNNFTVMN